MDHIPTLSTCRCDTCVESRRSTHRDNCYCDGCFVDFLADAEEERMQTENQTEETEEEPNFIRLYLAEAESGWGVLRDDGTVEIRNNALGSNLCVGDIVKIREVPGSLPVVEEIISEKMKYKFCIQYTDIEAYKAFRQECMDTLERGSFSVEGWIGPSERGPGLAAVAVVDEEMLDIIERHPDITRIEDDEEEE